MALPWHYLVFSGGGVRIYSVLGVLSVMHDLYPTYIAEHVRGLAGSSAGACVALMLTLGYTPAEIYEQLFLWSATFAWKFDEALRFTSHWGFLSKQVLTEFIESVIHKKTTRTALTFAELFQQTGKDLVICAVHVNRGQPVFFRHHTHPTMSVAQAVIASLSVPMLFAPSRLEEAWYIDGAILCDLPIEVFDGPVLAFQLCRPQQQDTRDWKEYIMTVLYLPMNHANELRQQRVQAQGVAHHILRIHTGPYGSFEFTLTETQKQQLFSFGLHYANIWLRPLLWRAQITFLVLEHYCASLDQIIRSLSASTKESSTSLHQLTESKTQEDITDHQATA